MWVGAAISTAVLIAACGGDDAADPDDPGLPYRLSRVARVGDVAFASGSYLTAPDQLGDRALIAFDVADPANPRSVDHLPADDVEIRGQVGDRLVGIAGGRSGADLLPLEVVLYTVADRIPTEERRIALPNSDGAMAGSVTAIGSRLVVGLESGATFVIDPDAGQIVATGTTPCRAIVEHRQLLICFDGLGAGSGTAARLRIDLPSATLVEESRATVPELGLPREAHVVGDRIVVVDGTVGWIRFQDDETGPLAVEMVGPTGQRGSTAHVIDPARVLYSTTEDLHIADAAISTLATSPFEASSIAMIDATQYLTAAGDQGVISYEVGGSTLVLLGGHYRIWSEVPGLDPAIREDDHRP